MHLPVAWDSHEDVREDFTRQADGRQPRDKDPQH